MKFNKKILLFGLMFLAGILATTALVFLPEGTGYSNNEIDDYHYDGVYKRGAAQYMLALEFNLDGTILYGQDIHNGVIREHFCSEAWSLSTCASTGETFDYLPGIDSFSYKDDFTWKPDGKRIFVSRDNIIYEFNCTDAWNLSTCFSDINTTIDISSTDRLDFENDGSDLFLLNSFAMSKYSCSEAWNVSTCVYESSITLKDQGSFIFVEDGTKFYNVGQYFSRIFQYDCTDAWNLTTCSYTGIYNRELEDIVDDLIDLEFSGDYSKLLVGGLDYRYELQYYVDYSIGALSWDLVKILGGDASTYSHYTNYIEFSNDGKYIVFPSYNSSTNRERPAALYYVNNWSKVLTLSNITLTSVAFSNNGEYIAYSTEDDCDVLVYNTTDWTLAANLSDASSSVYGVYDIEFSQDDGKISFTDDLNNLIYETSSWNLVASINESGGIYRQSDGLFYLNDEFYFFGQPNLVIYNTTNWDVIKNVSDPTIIYYTTDSFWDINTSNQTGSSSGDGKITSDMKDIDTYVSWDILEVEDIETKNENSVWNIVDGASYPFFSLENLDRYINSGLSSPIEIYTWEDMANIKNNLSANFILMNDLNSSTIDYIEFASPSADNGSGWLPLNYFAGNLNGNNYTIDDLYINRSNNNVGLFGVASGDIINLGMNNLTIIGTGSNSIGGLAGFFSGLISNCYSNGYINGGTYYVGGLVGDLYGTINNSYSSVNIYSSDSDFYFGGLVGYSVGIISNSYATGNVSVSTSGHGIGGLLGGLITWTQDDVNTISNSYATGNVDGGDDIGGLIGRCEDAALTNSYATGNSAGDASVGGLIGSDAACSISNSYSIGDVSGNSAGGLTGAGGQSGTCYKKVISDDSSHIACVIDNKRIQVLNATSLELITSLINPSSDYVKDIDFSNDEKYFAYGTSYDENNVYVYDIEDNWSATQILQESFSGVQTVSFSSDSNYLTYGGSNDEAVYVHITDIDKPTLYIKDPIDNYATVSEEVNFTFKASDNQEVDRLLLYSNWTGKWALNYSNISPENDTWITESISGIPEGIHSWYLVAVDSSESARYSENRTLVVDHTAPIISVDSPRNEVYSVTAMDINYTSVDGILDTESCWYNIEDDNHNIYLANTTLVNCQNSSMNFPAGDNDYYLNLYSNDTLGNERKKTTYFGTRTEAPAIALEPTANGGYLNYVTDIPIKFTATDVDGIDTCYLYSDWNGEWEVNEIFTSVDSGVQISTLKNISEMNNYTWDVWCNDSTGASDTSLEKEVLHIDTTLPDIKVDSINQITTTKYLLADVDVVDENVGTCSYSVLDIFREPVNGEDVSYPCNSVFAFETPDFSDYILELKSFDLADNSNSIYENFTVSNETTPAGGAGTITIIDMTNATRWEMSTSGGGENYQITISPGIKRTSTVIYENLGETDRTIGLECIDSVGSMCQYVTLESANISLPIAATVKTYSDIYIEVPEDAEIGDAIFIIRGTDDLDNSDSITFETTIKSDFIGIILSKLFSSAFYILGLLAGTIALGISLRHFIFKKSSAGGFISGIIGFVISVVIIYLI